MKLRLDQYLCQNGLVASRERAKALIMAGVVFVVVALVVGSSLLIRHFQEPHFTGPAIDNLTVTETSADAYDIAPPDPSGAGQERALRLALENAGVSTADLVHVNAHATSTPAGDGVEATAIRRALGAEADHVAVSATKSMTGHLLGGAGALESLLTVLAVHHRTAPPTINVTDPEPDLEIDLVRDTPRELPQGQIAAVNNAFGFGGHNVALVVASS